MFLEQLRQVREERLEKEAADRAALIAREKAEERQELERLTNIIPVVLEKVKQDILEAEGKGIHYINFSLEKYGSAKDPPANAIAVFCKENNFKLCFKHEFVDAYHDPDVTQDAYSYTNAYIEW